MHPVIALVTAGVEMDVRGIAYEKFPDAQRETVVASGDLLCFRASYLLPTEPQSLYRKFPFPPRVI